MFLRYNCIEIANSLTQLIVMDKEQVQIKNNNAKSAICKNDLRITKVKGKDTKITKIRNLWTTSKTTRNYFMVH